jgi:uncharacterized protein YndB with AHSA1/START domain
MAAPTKSAYKITLPSDRQLVMTRVFMAPRELVFRAHVDPALIPQWWGPRGNTASVEKLDARPGGAWRFVVRRDDGSGEVAFFGEFREVVPPERFTWTFGFDGLQGPPGLETYVFEEHDGQTTLTSTGYFSSAEERDAVLASGMEAGANESADRLEELLARLQV